ncbi:MAG: AgmX/PglI C-terminal domain-containing protein [Nannocystaceae bacterium]|nr:AgmX/PglI C-terminal domain-containing protein [Nannocystaceae bacterium]
MSAATVTLKVFSGGQCVATHRVARDMVKIGRLPTSHLRLDDEAIARMHAVLEVHGDELRLIDLGSATGTLVNGTPVERSVAIHRGDRIELGPYSVLVDVEAPSRTVAPAIAVDVTEHEHATAPAVAQIVARWRDRVIDVQHLGHARRRDAAAWLALGGLLCLGGGALFAHDVTQDFTSHAAEVKAAAEAGRPTPPAPGWGTGGIGMVLALAGLVPLGLGIVRQREQVRDRYILGEGPDASIPVGGTALREPLTLVRRDQSGIVLQLSPELRGFVERAGARQELAGGAGELRLEPGTRAQVTLGELRFDVTAVAPGRVLAGRGETDRAYWGFNAASLAIIGGMLGLSQLVPDDALAMSSDETAADNRYVGFLHQPDEAPPPEEIDELGPNDSESVAGLAGRRAEGEEGAMGDPSKVNVRKMYATKGPKSAVPQLARNFDPNEQAREAGVLGLMQLESGHFLASPHGAAFAVGNDDEDVWGNLTGSEIGASGGMAGLGLVGSGRGGGGDGAGTIGLTGVGLIGQRGDNGTRLGYGDRNGRNSGTAFEGRGPRKPSVRVADIATQPSVDKEIIRRVVRSHINEVRACYSQGLVRDPNLRGRVAVQFTIGSSGTVGASAVAESSLDDAQVGSCIAKAVRRWRFPTGATAGSAVVTYPFVLNPG